MSANAATLCYGGSADIRCGFVQCGSACGIQSRVDKCASEVCAPFVNTVEALKCRSTCVFQWVVHVDIQRCQITTMDGASIVFRTVWDQYAVVSGSFLRMKYD